MLLLAEYQIYNPAPTDVRTRASAVVEDLGVFAPGVLECVGQNRHGREVARIVHLAGEGDDCVSAP
jgi:hypothetical protein